MLGGNKTQRNPTGAFTELLAAAEERGSLTGEELATVLDAPELEVAYETEWSVGGVDE